MYTNVNFTEFCDKFRAYDCNNNFSYEGKRVLFDYLEELEDDIGEQIELDIIALCCDYSEDSIENVLVEYNMDSLEELEDSTMVLRVNEDTIIYQSF